MFLSSLVDILHTCHTNLDSGAAVTSQTDDLYSCRCSAELPSNPLLSFECVDTLCHKAIGVTAQWIGIWRLYLSKHKIKYGTITYGTNTHVSLPHYRKCTKAHLWQNTGIYGVFSTVVTVIREISSMFATKTCCILKQTSTEKVKWTWKLSLKRPID